MNIEFRKKFKSRISIAQKVISEILEQVEGAISGDDLFDIRLILNELIYNSIIHGNKGDEEKHVFLILSIDDEKIDLKVIDEGEGIMNNSEYNPELLSTNGRGLVLVKGLSDCLSIDGNAVRVVKKINLK